MWDCQHRLKALSFYWLASRAPITFGFLCLGDTLLSAWRNLSPTMCVSLLVAPGAWNLLELCCENEQKPAAARIRASAPSAPAEPVRCLPLRQGALTKGSSTRSGLLPRTPGVWGWRRYSRLRAWGSVRSQQAAPALNLSALPSVEKGSRVFWMVLDAGFQDKWSWRSRTSSRR